MLFLESIIQILILELTIPNFENAYLGSSFAPEQVTLNKVHLALNFENKDGTRVSSCMPNKEKLGGKHVYDGLGVPSVHFRISMLQGLNLRSLFHKYCAYEG